MVIFELSKLFGPERSGTSWSTWADTAGFLLCSVAELSEVGNELLDLISDSSKGVFYPLRLGVVIFGHPQVGVLPFTSVIPESPMHDRPSSIGASFMTSKFLWCPAVAFSPQAYVSPISTSKLSL